MTCRYDSTAGDYLRPDDTPCRHDDYGDPTHHCTARRTCAQHVGPNELTCARCLGRTRRDIRHIVALTALMLPEATFAGVNSEAATLAGPAADPEAWLWHKVARRNELYARHGDDDEALLAALEAIPEDDERHPLSLLGRWNLMLAEDYDLPTPPQITLASAAEFLDRNLGKVAQDEDQDFGLLATELRKCRSHLETVIQNSQSPQRGVPCPECKTIICTEHTGATRRVTGCKECKYPPRLVREYGHWCFEEDCARLHYIDDSGDRWVCPRDRAHVWDVGSYERYLTERRGA